jgi:hypothetical protein
MPTSVAQILEVPNRYVGRCVTLTAPTNGHALYESRQELDRFERTPRESEDFQMIGVYLPPEVDEEKELIDRNLTWTVTGRVDTCERIWTRTRSSAARVRPTRGSIRLVGVPGYCHTRHGPVVTAHFATVYPD